MRRSTIGVAAALVLAVVAAVGRMVPARAESADAPERASVSQATVPTDAVVITAGDCTDRKLGTEIPKTMIGEPVAGVTLAAPRWAEAIGAMPGYCTVDGVMAPVDTHETARPINFRVILPASWNHRGMQIGGGGFNGVIPNLTGGVDSIAGSSPLQRGFVTYGSDSGHQSPGFGGRGAGAPGAPGLNPAMLSRGTTPVPPGANITTPPMAGSAPPAAAQADSTWALNEEVMKNLGYMQMKKTHDAAMVLVERMYGTRPQWNYYVGTSQGGREALTVAQRYPADYNGIIANVPIVNFSSLMLGPELIRIQEKPLANWVTRSKINAIRGEFMRQCDALDGLADGVMNNYMGCRAIFDLSEGAPNRQPWAAKRCPNGVDLTPNDSSGSGCLTDGQISTLQLVYSRYRFATPLAFGVKTFGMWVPTTDPSGSGLIADARFRGQEGAAENAPMHTHLGILGVTGFLMQNLQENPLDYVEGGALDARRRQISPWLDSTDPDLSAFARRGGKMIVTIGTDDTLASPGSQLDYYQSLVEKMGRPALDGFARLFVIAQANHGLRGNTYSTDGLGRAVSVTPVPSSYDRLGPLMEWVEQGNAPPRSLLVTSGDRSLPLCAYPTYPRYQSGPAESAASYACTAP